MDESIQQIEYMTQIGKKVIQRVQYSRKLPIGNCGECPPPSGGWRVSQRRGRVFSYLAAYMLGQVSHIGDSSRICGTLENNLSKMRREPAAQRRLAGEPKARLDLFFAKLVIRAPPETNTAPRVCPISLLSLSNVSIGFLVLSGYFGAATPAGG